jgi:CheY-like chemotaxis protein
MTTGNFHGPLVVLVAEDNLDHFTLMRLALEAQKGKVQLEHVINGMECLAFLRKQGKYATAPTADLLFLDISMPVMDGYDVMEQITRDPALRELPVIVLTTSGAEEHVHRMYAYRCNGYVVKPIEFDEFERMMGALIEMFTTVITLPTRIHR